MQDLYKKIRPRKVPDEIVRQIKALIKDGKLRPGEKLPSERAFSQMLGVGRSSLREALNTLQATGFLEIRKRQGIYVRNVSTPLITDPLRQLLAEDRNELTHLYELRKDIEMAAAFHAAERRNARDLANIRGALKRMQKGLEAGAISLRDDLDFHLGVAHASHNILRVHVLKNIFDLSAEFLGVVLGKLSREPANLPFIVSHHQAILKTIEEQDKATARRAMKDHLSWVEEKWLERESEI